MNLALPMNLGFPLQLLCYLCSECNLCNIQEPAHTESYLPRLY
jgi:hypothetical protein